MNGEGAKDGAAGELACFHRMARSHNLAALWGASSESLAGAPLGIKKELGDASATVEDLGGVLLFCGEASKSGTLYRYNKRGFSGAREAEAQLHGLLTHEECLRMLHIAKTSHFLH
jgi:hypothetical protein